MDIAPQYIYSYLGQHDDKLYWERCDQCPNVNNCERCKGAKINCKSCKCDECQSCEQIFQKGFNVLKEMHNDIIDRKKGTENLCNGGTYNSDKKQTFDRELKELDSKFSKHMSFIIDQVKNTKMIDHNFNLKLNELQRELNNVNFWDDGIESLKEMYKDWKEVVSIATNMLNELKKETLIETKPPPPSVYSYIGHTAERTKLTKQLRRMFIRHQPGAIDQAHSSVDMTGQENEDNNTPSSCDFNWQARLLGARAIFDNTNSSAEQSYVRIEISRISPLTPQDIDQEFGLHFGDADRAIIKKNLLDSDSNLIFDFKNLKISIITKQEANSKTAQPNLPKNKRSRPSEDKDFSKRGFPEFYRYALNCNVSIVIPFNKEIEEKLEFNFSFNSQHFAIIPKQDLKVESILFFERYFDYKILFLYRNYKCEHKIYKVLEQPTQTRASWKVHGVRPNNENQETKWFEESTIELHIDIPKTDPNYRQMKVSSFKNGNSNKETTMARARIPLHYKDIQEVLDACQLYFRLMVFKKNGKKYKNMGQIRQFNPEEIDNVKTRLTTQNDVLKTFGIRCECKECTKREQIEGKIEISALTEHIVAFDKRQVEIVNSEQSSEASASSSNSSNDAVGSNNRTIRNVGITFHEWIFRYAEIASVLVDYWNTDLGQLNSIIFGFCSKETAETMLKKNEIREPTLLIRFSDVELNRFRFLSIYREKFKCPCCKAQGWNSYEDLTSHCTSRKFVNKIECRHRICKEVETIKDSKRQTEVKIDECAKSFEKIEDYLEHVRQEHSEGSVHQDTYRFIDLKEFEKNIQEVVKIRQIKYIYPNQEVPEKLKPEPIKKKTSTGPTPYFGDGTKN